MSPLSQMQPGRAQPAFSWSCRVYPVRSLLPSGRAGDKNEGEMVGGFCPSRGGIRAWCALTQAVFLMGCRDGVRDLPVFHAGWVPSAQQG